MSYRIREVKKFITWAARVRNVLLWIAHRPVNQQRPTNYVLTRDKPPIATVQAFVAIVAHHEILAFRDNQLTVFDQLFHLLPPVAFEPRHSFVEPRKIIAEVVLNRRTEAHILLRQESAIHVHLAIYEPNP